MAANRIKGITVEIGGDVTGLDKALKSVNGNIRDTQAQLKDVERLLKLDPGNVELLRQKHQLLNEQLKASKDRLETLRKAEQQLKDSGVDENSAQFQALRREIMETETQVGSLQEAADRSNVALSKIASTADAVASGASRVADATAGISKAAAGGLTALAGLGIKAAKNADDLNTLAKQTGFTTGQLQKMQYAADLIDVEFTTVTGSMSRMKKNMASDSESVVAAFARIGVATRDDVTKELRSANDVFYDVLDGLSRVENETERDTLAMAIFGRSADQLAGIIDDGGAALKAFGDEAERDGLILGQDTLDRLNETNDTLDRLKAKAQGTLAVSGAAALDSVAPLVEKGVDMISAVLDKVSQLSPGQMRLILMVLAAVAGISPLAGVIANIASAVSSVSTAMTGIPKAFTAVSGVAQKVFAFVAANPIVLIIAAIVALVTAIAVYGDQIQAKLQQLDDWLQGVFAKDWTEIFGPVLGEALNALFANVKSVWDSVKAVFDGIIDFVRGVFTGDWDRAWNGIKEIFSGVFGALETIAKAPLNGIIGLINGLIGGVNLLIRKLNGISITPPAWVTKLTGIGSFGFNLAELSRIPYLANGGILSQGSAIVGEAGPELLTMMGGRAVVQPLSSTTNHNHNLGGVNITVYGAPGQNVRELADVIMTEMQHEIDRREAVFA